MRVFVLILTLGCFLLSALPAQAHSALPPGNQPIKYSRWSYPSQMSYGPIEDGLARIGQPASPGAFMTLPFMGRHYTTATLYHYALNRNVIRHTCRYYCPTGCATVVGPHPC